MQNRKPKIGIALSGGSGRAITHIGVLEVLKEQGVSIDYLTACSSGTIIAASFACGTMEILKRDWVKLDKKFLLSLFRIDPSGKGLFTAERAVSWVSKYCKNLKFEEVNPTLGFVSVDINSGEPIILNLGDIAKATKASCTIPGLFEPVEWGNRLLVDGGLISIIPTHQAKEMGADIVIGVDIAARKYIFTKFARQMRRGYNLFKKTLPVRIYAKIHGLLDRLFTSSIDFIFYSQSDIFEETGIPNQTDFFSTLGKAMDISLLQSKKKPDYLIGCDYLISPPVKHYGRADFVNASQMIELGRKATLEAIPQIKKVIRDWEWRHNHV